MDLVLSILSGALWSWSAQTQARLRTGSLLLPVETVKTLLYCLEPLEFPPSDACLFLQHVILALTLAHPTGGMDVFRGIQNFR